MIDAIILFAQTIIIFGAIFIPKTNKRVFYIYFITMTISITVMCSILYYEMFICPSYAVFGVIMFSPIFIIPTTILVQRVNSILKKDIVQNGYDNSLKYYLLTRLLHRPLLKLGVSLFVIFILFQFFLIYSSNKAYNQAVKRGVDGIEKITMWDFYSPFMKDIYIDDTTRWSYHRECYVKRWK